MKEQASLIVIKYLIALYNFQGRDHMKELPKIHLERLTLRPFNFDDAIVVKELAGDKHIAEMTLNIPHPYEDGMAKEWIETHADNFNENRILTLAITHKKDKYLIGAMSIGFNNNYDRGELAY